MLDKTVLVSGAAGFIGSHFCELLLKEGYRVIGMDNLVTGSADNIASYRQNPRFQFLQADVTKPLPDTPHLDFIAHMASPASPVDFTRIPVEIMLVNSLGTLHLLEVARKNGARFLMASTSEVYGDPEQHPQREEYRGNVSTTGPRSCYDEGKRFSEALTVSFQREYTTSVCMGRIFNTYGPKMRKDDGRVIPNFMMQALSNQPITIYGDGKQTRSFCYVSDTIAGLYKLMTSDKTGPVNIGNPDEYTMIQMAQRVIALTGSSSKLTHEPLPVDDPVRRRPDITRAKQLLGWQPSVSLDDGLRATIDWFKLAYRPGATARQG